MSKVDPNASRSSFFPRSKTAKSKIGTKGLNSGYIQRNEPKRIRELNHSTGSHAKVEIPSAVRDFAKIKKAVDQAPEVDNSEKIARLKEQINAGTYKVDYDSLADKILSSEF